MKCSYNSIVPTSRLSVSTAVYAPPTNGRDFTTLDGMIVPRTLGEIALRQGTALLIGGILIGEWPENL